MAIKFGMPSLGHTMEKGKIIEWLKQEGETLTKGEPMVVIETDKVVTEVEAPVDSVLVRIVVGQEEERPIGATLALLGSPGESLSDADIQQLLGDESPAQAAPVPPAPVAAAPAPVASAPVAAAPAAGDRVKISPVARKLAQERGLDLATIPGSGPGGRITKEDVLRAAEAPAAAAPAVAASGERVKISPIARKLAQEYGIDAATVTGTGPGGRVTKDDILQAVEASKTAPAAPAPSAVAELTAETIPLTGIRGRVAERMYESWNTIPRVTEVMQVDMSATVAFREAMLSQWEQQFGVRISLNDLITKAVAVALGRHPRLNATMGEREVRVHDQINIGVAVNLDEGLIVPVVRQVDRKDLGQIARESRELAERARSGRLQLDELSDGTFTITNLGTTGIDLFTPIINPPQVAILGVGMVQRRPVVVGDALAIRPSAYLCLVFDHRAVDGVPAARFLQELQQLLAKPQDYAL
ncbi:dihydrolipoamide acetyltransferase family protein [Candidatus Entotheonella palauensis]|uniref:dihydrolipoamide acetyltransferase family protein n=1 Tax=Candidatus Entotheonella palauensis TaxID=93172 RepID=UPI000B7D36DA|nr:dihydrolipoamide acetyltransferase family protein [Candidatus Entotheonella palauensis]